MKRPNSLSLSRYASTTASGLINRISHRSSFGLKVMSFTVSAWVAAAVLLAPTSALAGPPCGGVTLVGKRVKTGAALSPIHPLSASHKACAKAIGAALVKKGRVRSVTVVVRVANKHRLDGLGKRIARAWSAALAGAGIPAARISVLVPPVRAGGKPEISIAFRAAGNRRPVALVQAATGDVRGGPRSALVSLKPGSKLANRDLVVTAAGSVVRIALADGSFVSLAPQSRVRIGRIELTRDLKRRVQLDLLSGKIETRAWYKKKGESFEIHTKTGIAGVRGTHFRVGMADGGKTTVVETLEGVVELSSQPDKDGKRHTISIPAGKMSRVSAGGKPTPLRQLLSRPDIDSPLKGAVKRGVHLKWDAVDGAVQYHVEIAADAEFARNVAIFRVKTNHLETAKTRAAGRWFWRLTAVDKFNVVGMPSKIYSFDLAAITKSVK